MVPDIRGVGYELDLFHPEMLAALAQPLVEATFVANQHALLGDVCKPRRGPWRRSSEALFAPVTSASRLLGIAASLRRDSGREGGMLADIAEHAWFDSA